MGLQKALKVEKALREAIEAGQVGSGELYDFDGEPCCLIGHGLSAVGAREESFIHMTPADFGVLPEYFDKMLGRLWNVALLNDSGEQEQAAVMLVGMLEEWCDEEDRHV